MKNHHIKSLSVAVFLFSVFFILGCKEPFAEKTAEDTVQAIFPQGNVGPAEFFTGKAYNYGLLPNDSIYNTLIGNVYFEPGARSNWHTHPSGQILIITDGVGYHQLEGQPHKPSERAMW